jgi:hypothetical protein
MMSRRWCCELSKGEGQRESTIEALALVQHDQPSQTSLGD